MARAAAKINTLDILRGAKPPPARGYALRYFYRGTRRDDDNAIAGTKSYLDGIADALGVNDRDLIFRGYSREKDTDCPRMEIVVDF